MSSKSHLLKCLDWRCALKPWHPILCGFWIGTLSPNPTHLLQCVECWNLFNDPPDPMVVLSPNPMFAMLWLPHHMFYSVWSAEIPPKPMLCNVWIGGVSHLGDFPGLRGWGGVRKMRSADLKHIHFKLWRVVLWLGQYCAMPPVRNTSSFVVDVCKETMIWGIAGHRSADLSHTHFMLWRVLCSGLVFITQ